MSETDSFIDEVSEEVRRDKLFGYMRRYGWIAVLAILAIVGGAAWSEWSKAQNETQAQDLGDALIAAIENEDATERAAAFAAIETTGPASAIAAMLTAANQQEAGDVDAALATLNDVSGNADVPQVYRDLAQLKMLIAGAGTMDEDERRAGLETLAVPGQTFRMPALEHLALSTLASGDTDGAIAAFELLIADAEASEGLQARAEALIVAIGAGTDVEDVPSDETAPEETALEETLTDETVADETVADETVADETTIEETPTDDTPTDDTTPQETPDDTAQDDE